MSTLVASLHIPTAHANSEGLTAATCQGPEIRPQALAARMKMPPIAHRRASSWAACMARVFEREITAGASQCSPPRLAHEIKLLHILVTGTTPLLSLGPPCITLSHSRSGEVWKIEVITTNILYLNRR